MAQHAQCCLPSFDTTSDGPKRPVSIKTRITPSQSTKLLSAFKQGSLDSLLKTAWGLLLYRYTGLEDVCFGYQRHGVGGSSESSVSDTERFSTCKLAINEDDTVRSLLKKFKEEDGLDDSTGLGGAANVNHNDYSLFNTVVMVRVCGDRAKDGTFVRPPLPTILSEECRARLHVKILRQDVCIFLECWNTDISTTQIESVARYFEHLIDQVLFGKEIAAIDAGCFLQHDWSRICKFNSVEPKEYDRCIHDVIRENTRLHPQREAICSWDGSFTYEELDRLASELALHLQTQGVGPEVRVALCFDKSKWNIVAMLGVLKAGGAFVPLDPTHPTSRLRSLVTSVDAKIMLCSRSRADILDEVTKHLIPLDEQTFVEEIEDLSGPSGATLREEARGNNAAYLIFTSGSTGQPKGTLLEHKAFVSAAMAYGEPMDMDSECRILQFAAHTFDASLFESIAPLIHGGCVCIPSDGERLNDIIRAINRMNVNVVCLTPSFVRFIEPSSIPGVKTIILVGEAMSRSDLESWSHIKLVNGYGPTESAVCAAINSDIHLASDCRDIGLPTGVCFWIVNPDDHNQLVPVGSPGELLLEGPTLARCYINNPQKTNEVFIHNPDWARDENDRRDRRFYKTGDLVRYNSEAGSLIFIGRKDTQIKLHGQRIELGEIENSITTLPIVKHCLTFFCKSGSAQGKIVAVVSLQGESSHAVPLKLMRQPKSAPAVTEVRQQLMKRLPTYMIPAVWLCVEALPLLPSGKLNRKETVTWATDQTDELPTQTGETETGEGRQGTRLDSTVEERLASIWSRVLAIPRHKISFEESFLALGGDSIAAITCMGYCKKQSLGVTVQDILQSESICDLATRVKEVHQPVEYREVVGKPFGLSPIQKLHFMIRNEGQGYFNQGIRTRLNRPVTGHDLRSAVEVIVKRHSMLRARLVKTLDNDLQQRITDEVDTSYRLRVHDIEQHTEVDIAVADSQLCIDAFEGPILSVDLFYTNEDCILSMVAHHLVVDIVSWRIILEDLEEILLRPDENGSSANSLPFSSWCHLQDERAESVNDDSHVPIPDLAYWGLEDQVVTYGDVTCEAFELSSEDSHAILMDCHKSLGTEPIDVLLASLLHSFGQTFRDRPPPAIFNEGHGREVWDPVLDISRTVGWFTTVFPVSLPDRITDDPIDTVVLVKDLRRRVSDNGRQQFASLMSASAEKQGRKHPCPMEVTFNYVGQHRDLQRRDGLFQLMNQMAGETGQGGGASDFGQDTPRFGLFEISALAVNGRIRFVFSFSKYMRHQERIRTWVASCGDVLRSLGKTLQTILPKPTLSDFPMLSLTYPMLDTMFGSKLLSLGVGSPDLIEDIYPCSRMQQGILLARSRDPSLYAVHDTYQVRVPNGLPDADNLVDAWRLVVSRHAMLRTLFVENLTDRELFGQVVLKSCEPSIIYLSCLNIEDVVSTFENNSPAEYHELLPHHRLSISMDGVSISIILRDLQLAYSGELSHHKPLFKKYVQYLHSAPQAASIEYWRSYLAAVKPCLFPTLTDGKSVSQRKLGTLRVKLESFSALLSVCEERRLTLSTAFTAAWGLTLRLFCNSDDVCFSYMTSLRDSFIEDIESMVGPVINLLACRMKLSTNDSLKDVLQRVQGDFMEQLSHNSLSFIDIQRECKLSDSAMFNTGISFQKTPRTDSAQSSAGISFSRIANIHDPAEYPLFVNVVASDKAADIELNYWTNTLSDAQAENVSRVFLKCLENIIHHHGEQLSKLDSLGESDRQRIRKWNKQQHDDTDGFLPDIIREQAASHPDASAIVAWDKTLNYEELDRLSSRLAAYLVRLGVRTGTLVPVCFTKSVWQVVAILAILKAGAVCVPRDKSQSADSLDKWLIDKGAHTALTSPSGIDLLEGKYPVAVAIDSSLFENLSEPSSMSGSLQYYDSGYVALGTGWVNEFSGILLDQPTMVARAAAFASAMKMDSTVRTFQFVPNTSEIFVQELFGTLMRGGCVCIPKDKSLEQLSQSINAANANSICLPPTIASLLRPSDVPRIQNLALFGELPTQEVQRIWAGKVRLHSFLGAPECSSTCIQNLALGNMDSPATMQTTLGYSSWLVDTRNSARLVPVGCVGELVIEGSGVSRGYISDAKRTEDRFLADDGGIVNPGKRPHPAFPRPRRQMYRTGQLARYNSDGSLVYLGKKAEEEGQQAQSMALRTEQVLGTLSLSGYRCLTEVISLNSGQYREPYVAVFIASENQPVLGVNNPAVVLRKTSDLHQVMTRAQTHLTASLPAGQVPRFYFPVSELPLTPLGVVNRSLLCDEVRTLSENVLLEYDVKAFGEYWRSQLAKPPHASSLLLQPPSSQQSAPKTIDRNINVPWNSNLKRQNARASILCAWALATCNYTESDDMIFGELLADASSSSQTTIIPRRLRIDKTNSIVKLLEQTTSLLTQAKPFESTAISSIKNLNADSARAADFETMICVSPLDKTQQIQALGHLQAGTNAELGLSMYPLAVFCSPKETEMHITAHYDAKVLYRSQVERLLSSFEECLGLFRYGTTADEKAPDLTERHQNLQNFSDSLDYWKEYLIDVEPCLFPALSPKTEKFRIGTQNLRLSNGAKIQSLCKALSLAPDFLLQTVWALVLRCYTGLEEVTLGYYASPEKASTGVWPCRISLNNDIKLRDAVLKRKEDFERAIEHHTPFSDIHRAIGSESSPVFNTAFSYTRSPARVAELSNITADNSDESNPYIIFVSACVSGASVEVHFGYQTASLSDSDMENIIDCFECTLNSVLTLLGPGRSPGRTIGDVEFLGQRSRRSLSTWNAVLPEKPRKCAHAIIQEQVISQPSAPAICSWDENFSYAQLSYLTTRLAYRLIDMGVGPEVFVGLCFEKSAWAVIAQVAVLKAGGAFASLDPAHPEGRLQGLVEDISAPVVLCSTRYADKVSRICNVALPVSQDTFDSLPSPSTVQRASTVRVDNAAYAIFTSGTTGKPKVTVLEHAALAVASKSFAKTLSIGPETRALQFSSYTFDVSILETIIVLMTGGCVCVPSDEERMNDLSGAIRRMQANLMSCTPSVTGTLNPGSVPSLMTVINGGEKLTESQIARWSHRRLFNAYGPSEATVLATASLKVDGTGRRLDDDSNSIGTAVCGRTWIVDPTNHNRLLPVGATGELVLEGYNIARGYLNNDKKTEEVFIKEPRWCRTAGLREATKHTGRMYRTGDLVRYKSDGNICFISRMDTQVKLNGQRIELEEIEQQCAQLSPENTQVAVDIILPATKSVAKALAAFFTVESHGVSSVTPQQAVSASVLLPQSEVIQAAITRLHSSLVEVLPQIMIPRFYFPVQYLPLGTTGKLDRKGLRAMVQTLSNEQLKPYMISNSRSAPEMAKTGDSTLRDLWAEVLDVEPGFISAEDSFFGLGGDSFSAMKLVGAARSHDISLTVAKIYEHPVLKDMVECCEEVTQAKARTHLEKFSLVPESAPLQEILEEITDQCGITEESISDVYPCSALQEGLLTLSIKNPGAYVARAIYRLAADIDLDKFKSSWQNVADEFDILRTRIVHTEAAGFLQVVLKRERISWTLETTLGNVDDEAVGGSGALLAKYSIVQLGPSERYFVWTVNHALYDGWNVGPMLKRVEDIYLGSSGPNITVPYKFFINYLVQRDMPKADEFWKTYLGGLSSEPFPAAKHQDVGFSRQGGIQRSSIDISRAPRATNITVPELIRAAWALVLSAHTGSGDVCFGETLMGRNIDMPGITDVAGPVLTTVPMRIRVNNKLPLTQYIHDIRHMTTSMIPHQHHGLQRIQKLGGDAALACNFQNLLVIQSDNGKDNEDIWRAEHQQTRGDFFTHPLVVECQLSGSSIEIRAHHDVLALDDWQAERLIGQFGFILEQLLDVSQDSSMTVGGIDFTSPLDKRDITCWNQRHVGSVDKCAHEIIREIALSQPQAPAVCSWDGDLNYGELLDLASSFATYLVSCGVGPETFVPICLDKSLWAMVTILSVLLAGGAFVPLDPSHPTSRHKEILEELGADIILCSPQLRSRFMGYISTIIPISKETITAYGAVTTRDKHVSISPSNTAYAIFTSGSTGRPKGIVIDHRAVCSSIIGFAPVVHLNKDSRVFQFASLTFDAAILETLGTLMLGGCICVPSDDERLNDIPAAMQRMNVTWTFLTPSVANILEPSSVPSLEILTCGGEALSRDVVAKWGQRLKFFGGYGPTETVVFALVNGDFMNHGFTCIGYGLPKTLTWIVDPDDHNRLAPLGAVGELALEGPVLAREYLNNPAKTADTFVEQPSWIKRFASSSSAPRRIYKTGDLARYNSDGSIEYLGRKDHQVKVNGQRMELGEIEHRVLESQNVRNAVVVLPKTGPLRNKLVGVVCLESLTPGTSMITTGACELVSQKEMVKLGNRETNEIKARIESQLPPYMVPQVWAVVKNIPMLVSGKLDRKKVTSWLEQVEESLYNRIMQEYDTMAPEAVDEQEESKEDEDTIPIIIRDICAQVLNLAAHKIDMSRSFIYLGGDSITGMAVVSKARKRGLNLPLNRILQSKSVDELAATCGEVKPRQTKNEAESSSFFPLSPIQELFFRSSPTVPKGSGRFNQSMTVRLTRNLEPRLIQDALRAIVRKHSMFRARFSKDRDGRWQQRITNELDPSYIFSTQPVKNRPDRLEKIANTQSSLDVQKGPVVAAALFDEAGQQILFLTASHLCVDVVSWRIVLQELEEFVDNGSVSSDAPLSFQSWCNLQLETSRNNKNTTNLSSKTPDLGYWGMDQMVNNYGHVKMESFSLDKRATAFISRQCHEILRTETVEVLLAAVCYSFNRVFSDRDLPAIYNEGHGREVWDSSDPSGTVGWFTTLSSLHAPACSGLLDTMKRVKDARRQTSESSRALFAKNVLQSDSSQFPVPLEVLFNYLGQLQQLERNGSVFRHYGDAFSAETMDSTGDMGPDTPRFALFEITAVIVKEQLNVSFTYNRNMKHQSRIRAWMAECKRALEIDLPNLKGAAPEPTLSDYPLLPATYDELQELTDTVLPRLGLASWNQVEDIYPCSSIQEGILFSQLRDPHEYIFNVIFEVCRPQESIDLTRLKNAWSIVVARHPSLRTVFIDSCCKGGSFDQVVVKQANPATVEIECDDFDAFGKLGTTRLQSSKKSLAPHHQLVFCKTSSGRVLVKFEMNHLIVDGGSFSILLKELALAYNGQLPPGSGPLFSDYIKYLKDEFADEALEYWKQHLSGVRECHLPVAEGTSGARQLGTHLVPFNRYTELQRFCERKSITLANLILAVWAIFLRAQTQSDDVCFGYPSTGRDLPVPGIQDAVGLLINNLCCRVKFQYDQTLLDISRLVQDDHMKSLAHQRSSLAEIQHALGRQGKPLFNTCISIQNHAADKIEIAGMSYKFQKAHDPCEYPLTANVETARGHEGILLRYWADAVPEADATAFAQSLARILTYFVEDPLTPISDLKVSIKENPAIAEQIDRSSLEKIVDERIKVIIEQMLGEGKLAKPSSNNHDAVRPTELLAIEKGIKNSFQELIVARGEVSTESTQTLITGDKAPSDIAKQLWGLWSSTLGLHLQPIKYKSSFFKLGGDSITAMKMVRAARDEGLKLSVAQVFKNPVFEDMLALVKGETRPVVSSIIEKYEEKIEDLIEEKPMLPRSESSQELSILRQVPVELDDASLRAAICPKVGVFKGGIVDVLPVTDFQALSLTATMFESRWMLNYFYLDGKGSLDVRRLRESFLRVVDAFDILRTVFVCFHGQFFQVVLRKIRPDIFVQETEKSLDEYTKSLQQRDRKQYPGQGQQYVQFYVVKKANSDEHRILIRMHHAQFDGVCLPKIMTAIKMAYEGSPVSPSSFLNYSRLLPGTITPEHYQHWSNLLKGSRMTQVVQRETSNTFQHIGGFAEQKKVIEIPTTATENVTIATVMQSAWAVTLAKLCAQDDVVFGLTVSGRNAVPGVESIVGPCLNNIPIRVRFRDRWTALDLFRFLQDQQVSNMTYESLGFRDIIRHCTDWPESTFFTTSVLHQNVDYEGQMQLDNNTYRMGGVGVIDNFTDLTLFSKPVAGHSTQLTVGVGYSLKGPMHPNFVSTVLDMVCDTAQNLVANPNVALPSPSTLRSLPPQLSEDTTATPGSDSLLLSSLNNRSLSDILAHSDLITRIWQQVLPPRQNTGKPQRSFQLDSSFFRLGGDVVNMAQVVWILEQETGLHIPIEELLEHSTFLSQMAVLALHMTKRDADLDGSSDAAPAYDAVDVSGTITASGREISPLTPSKSEWSALDKARVLAKKITKLGGLSTRV
ncbi:nonribosomal peptide synthase Pes1 [Aspergillus stella-maris]|uniref:nonribosomal peptide synthase Pes1 n=1 Tax=Aspergillus stella-maris TaxID=1810926 RepID=UPI003CCE34FA